uniref:DUF4817 domain-containing protein n=1 Tax=Lygus hesperus TaxID=30085 RepID=A0A0K8T774_LYGHE
MQWTGEQRAFAVETFFSNGRSFVATQRAFRAHFDIPPGGRVPGRQSISNWVDTFRMSFSVAPSPRVVSARRSHIAHCTMFNGSFEGALPRTPHLLKRGPSVACSVT